LNNNCNATWKQVAFFVSASAAIILTQKKKEKKKALSEGLDFVDASFST
jgi:hypothetical protein